MKQIEGSLEKLEKRRGRFKHPSSDNTAVFSAAVRSLILLKALKKGGELNQTGIFEGVFSKLGATVFSDLGIFTSSESSRLNQVITDLRASLKTISSSEGVDGRPSNFRMQLQDSVIPAFRNTQKVNEKNLDTLISKLENAVRSNFSGALASNTVIPQIYVRMAREAGIEDVDSDPRNYPWINPRVALEESLPVTKKRTLSALGLLPYVAVDIQGLEIGTLLPRDAKGRIYQKVSDTEIQQVVDGSRSGVKYKIADFFRPTGRMRK